MLIRLKHKRPVASKPAPKMAEMHGALVSSQKLLELQVKKFNLLLERHHALLVEFNLHRLGLSRNAVAHFLTPESLGSTDRVELYGVIPTCKNEDCRLYRLNQPNAVTCTECDTVLVEKELPLGMSACQDLRKHLVGVETKDGRRLFFQCPVPPRIRQMDLSHWDQYKMAVDSFADPQSEHTKNS